MISSVGLSVQPSSHDPPAGQRSLVCLRDVQNATAACHSQDASWSAALGATCSLQVREARWPDFSEDMLRKALWRQQPFSIGSDTCQLLCLESCVAASGVFILPPVCPHLLGLPQAGSPHRCGCSSPGPFPDLCGHRRHDQPGRCRNHLTSGRPCSDPYRYK